MSEYFRRCGMEKQLLQCVPSLKFSEDAHRLRPTTRNTSEHPTEPRSSGVAERPFKLQRQTRPFPEARTHAVSGLCLSRRRTSISSGLLAANVKRILPTQTPFTCRGRIPSSVRRRPGEGRRQGCQTYGPNTALWTKTQSPNWMRTLTPRGSLGLDELHLSVPRVSTRRLIKQSRKKLVLFSKIIQNNSYVIQF